MLNKLISRVFNQCWVFIFYVLTIYVHNGSLPPIHFLMPMQLIKGINLLFIKAEVLC